MIEAVRACMDRFELEDLFLPHRRPEPEVQLALDRGLGRLADLLVAPVPPERRAVRPQAEPGDAETSDGAQDVVGDAGSEPESASGPSEEPAEQQPQAGDHDPAATGDDDAHDETAHDETAHDETAHGTTAHDTEGEDGEGHAPDAGQGHGANESSSVLPVVSAAAGSNDEEALLHGQIELTPALARLCAPFVSPDRGVHTETEALSGAVRILSDRLGRDTRLRGLLRRMLRKQGVLSVRPLIDESKLGRHRGLLKLRQPLRQVQGHRLLAVRQAQKERAVQAVISLDRAQALPKVRQALGRHNEPEYVGVLDAVALRALEYRLLPLIEADVRLELKERADEEALRFLSQHLRQIAARAGCGHHPVGGIDVSAKGDWTLALVDEHGAGRGRAAARRDGDKDAADARGRARDAAGPGRRA